MTVIWDDKLITRERAANMSGTWELKMDYPYLRCGECDGNVTKLPSQGNVLNVDTVIAAVVRHMSCNHEYPLSGKGLNNGNGSADGSAIDIAVSRRSPRFASRPVY